MKIARNKKLMEEILKKKTLDINIGLPKGIMSSGSGDKTSCAVSQGGRGGLMTVIFNTPFWKTMKNIWTGNSVNIKKSLPEVSFIGKNEKGGDVAHYSQILKDEKPGNAGQKHIKLGITLDTPYEINISGGTDFYNDCASCGVIISDLNESAGIRDTAAKLLQKTKEFDISKKMKIARNKKLMEEILKKKTLDINIGLPKGIMSSGLG